MRTIKFRAWDKKKEKITPVTGFNNMNYSDDSEFKYICTGLGMIQYRHYELMQFTGLKDKNGKEIYEGDIVKYIEIDRDGIICEAKIGEVQYNDYTANFEIDGLGNFQYINIERDLEVIGNIYENKELLQ